METTIVSLFADNNVIEETNNAAAETFVNTESTETCESDMNEDEDREISDAEFEANFKRRFYLEDDDMSLRDLFISYHNEMSDINFMLSRMYRSLGIQAYYMFGMERVEVLSELAAFHREKCLKMREEISDMEARSFENSIRVFGIAEFDELLSKHGGDVDKAYREVLNTKDLWKGKTKASR